MFEQKSTKDIYIIYFLIVTAIFFFAYSLFWDSSIKEFQSTRKDIATLNSKIRTDNIYLRGNPQNKITQLNREITKIYRAIKINKTNNAYIKSSIEAISSLIYNEKRWGEYLDSISKDAQKYHVRMNTFTNIYSGDGKSFGHILDITINTTANYKNTLRFINSLEESDLVVAIHSFTMKVEDDRLITNLKISVWGIIY